MSDFEYRKSSLSGIEILKYIGKEKIVNIPPEIDGKKVDKIGNGAFMRSEVTSVTIPDSVTEMGSNVFYSCIELTSINIPNGVKEIGTMAFDDCIALKSITIPDSVTKIERGAFSGCKATVIYKGKTYTKDNYSELYTE